MRCLVELFLIVSYGPIVSCSVMFEGDMNGITGTSSRRRGEWDGTWRKKVVFLAAVASELTLTLAPNDILRTLFRGRFR